MRSFIVTGSLLLGLLTAVHPSLAATCTISTYNVNDIKDAEKDCKEITLNGISVPAGETLNLNLNQGTKLTFQGTLTWGFYEWDGPLLNISGTDVEISGAMDHVLDVRGNLWWDGKGGNGGKIKPIFFVAHGLRNSVIRNITVKNPSNHAIWIENSDGVIARDIYVDSRAGDTLGGHNTDGINVWTSNNVTILRLTVYNQDDCVAIKSGTNIVIKDSYCSGGHGLSIGSVGGRDYNIVENVLITNSQILNSDNGVRIKTVYGATGSVTNVTYEDITLKEINNYGIIIHGDYGSHAGVPTGGVPIKEFTLKNVTGNVKESGVNIYVFVKNATDWNWTEVEVTGGKKIKECDGIPEDSGITCY
ncbi:endopolygalacturonase 1-like [Anoplophora glabripennis]|uniref:endopolygalacturonase 1-like n=1 Tax=Anoplophora glabripennis TaxID=217634 RepID=UPI00087488FB|nr:endopolygalacturonase 1-like [Anoplophora glabripennis]